MEEKKVFSINPDLFSFKKKNSGNRTRKREAPKEKIKMNSNVKPNSRNDTLRKRSILRMIRNHHSEKNKERFNEYQNNLKPQNEAGDFELATKFFDNMTVKNENKHHNYSLKNFEQSAPNQEPRIKPSIVNTPIDLQLDLPKDENPLQLSNTALPAPKYGCLKNGSLPTYRDYMNRTRKVDDDKKAELIENTVIMQKTQEKLKNLKKAKRKKYRKKTIKRSYKTGRSKIRPEISILLANKTMRNNIIEKQQMIKQVSIPEIRTYLINNGFIKIGSTTPNDVLRKMYESALLICGEVKNYNKETLLYNFMNDKD